MEDQYVEQAVPLRKEMLTVHLAVLDQQVGDGCTKLTVGDLDMDVIEVAADEGEADMGRVARYSAALLVLCVVNSQESSGIVVSGGQTRKQAEAQKKLLEEHCWEWQEMW